MPGKLTLAALRRKLDAKHPVRTISHVSRNTGAFGSDALAITIGCSRRYSPPRNDTPGPGSYEPLAMTFSAGSGHKIQDRYETDYATLSSSIDFLRLQPFSAPSSKISRSDPTSFIPESVTPGPSYFPATPKRGITIGLRINERPEETTPGPGDYDVVVRPDSALISIPRNGDRGVWAKSDDVPGPGAYNVTPTVKRQSRWAARLRVRPKSTNTRLSLRDEIENM